MTIAGAGDLLYDAHLRAFRIAPDITGKYTFSGAHRLFRFGNLLAESINHAGDLFARGLAGERIAIPRQ